jgi:hypothetical protein
MLKRRKEKPSPRRKFFRLKRKAFSFLKFSGRKANRFFLEGFDTVGQASTLVVPVVEASETSEWSGRVYEIRFSPLHYDEYSRGDTAPLYQPEAALTNKPSQSTVVSIERLFQYHALLYPHDILPPL